MDLDIYKAIRPKMQTGDLILWSSSSIIGWLIRKFSGSDVNHASLVIRFTEYDVNRVYVLEALEFGIVLRALSERLGGHNGQAYWLPVIDELNSRRDDVGSIALANVGKRYDYGSLFKQIACRVNMDAQKFFCSEYFAYCWQRAGVPYYQSKAPRPGDLLGWSILKRQVKL